MPEICTTHDSATRQHLEFPHLDAAVQYAEQLHRGGYHSLGNWNLAQVCEHLSDWMEYMLDGYPATPLPIKPVLWGLRITVGKSILHKMLATGQMRPGGRTLKQTVHKQDDLEDATSLRRFRQTVERFAAHDGDYHASPIFGPLSAKAGLKLQLVHCAHHLSFLRGTT